MSKKLSKKSSKKLVSKLDKAKADRKRLKQEAKELADLAAEVESTQLRQPISDNVWFRDEVGPDGLTTTKSNMVDVALEKAKLLPTPDSIDFIEPEPFDLEKAITKAVHRLDARIEFNLRAAALVSESIDTQLARLECELAAVNLQLSVLKNRKGFFASVIESIKSIFN
jgi:hypothetical protein